MALLVSILLFAVFSTDVFIDAGDGRGFLNEVEQMLTLLGSVIAFVVAILHAESRAKARQQGQPTAQKQH